MSALKPSEVLAKAADLIEPEGAWRKGPRGPGRCLVEATAWCAPRGTNWWDVVKPLRRITDFNLSAWNDAPERTQAEVVAALRKAAALAAEEGQ